MNAYALEAIMSGRRAAVADSNPLARLITKVKSTPIAPSSLLEAFNELKLTIQLDRTELNKPQVVNIGFWYREKTIKQLSAIKVSIDSIEDNSVRDFFLVCFSNTVKKVSWSDPKLSVPVKLRKDKYDTDSKHHEENLRQYRKIETIDALHEFFKVVEANIKRMDALASYHASHGKLVSIYNDARSLRLGENGLQGESVKLIITSPPYAGAQKYIRASSLNLGWLGYCENNTLRDYERQNIGREHHSKAHYEKFVPTNIKEADEFLLKIFSVYPLRAVIASTYLIEMRDALKEMYRVLEINGSLVLVTAANQICGKSFETNKYLTIIAESIGFSLELALMDDIHSRGLMTKRNKTAGIINSEWVYIFRKRGHIC